MKKFFQYILMTVALVATVSCSNELDEVLQPAGNGSLQFVVSDFPAFGESPGPVLSAHKISVRQRGI